MSPRVNRLFFPGAGWRRIRDSDGGGVRRSMEQAAAGPSSSAPTRLTILKDVRLVNLFSGEIDATDIAISGERIVSIDPLPIPADAEVIDCAGLLALPGMIDAHMHVDTTFVWPGELA